MFETTAPAERFARLLDEFRAGRRTALARAISVVEDERPGFETLLDALYPATGAAHRVGITGPPGAGKSTLTAALVPLYRQRGETTGIIAVDPTSPFTGGALLGDRIRMNEVGLDEGVFIRSMATRGSLGGLAVTTKEVADVVDAFGFDRILIETVGVGQSELDIAAAADTTVVVLVPESGDAIQAMKAGLMEIADLFVVNKADRPGADRLAREIEMMLHLRAGTTRPKAGRKWHGGHHGPGLVGSGPAAPRGELRVPMVGTDSGTGAVPGPGAAPGHGSPASEPAVPSLASNQPSAPWSIPVLETVASTNLGMVELQEALDRHRAWLVESGTLEARRRERLARRVRETVMRSLGVAVWQRHGGDALLEESLPELVSGATTPYRVAARIVRAALG